LAEARKFMVRINDTSCAAFEQGSVILMARIIDRNGVPIRRSDIGTIEYSVFELDFRRPENLSAVCGQEAVVLDVADVIFDSPQIGDWWTVDAMGYNFRHQIYFARNQKFSKAGLRYEVRYEVTLTGGQQAVIRFRLKPTQLTRSGNSGGTSLSPKRRAWLDGV
jgi:hypothetical protein